MKSPPKGTVSVPLLNPYILSTARRDEDTAFMKLSNGLVACADSPDERQLKHLQQSVLPTLTFFAALPAVVIPPLYSITKHLSQSLRKDHKKLLRFLYYHLHVLLGTGRAGTNGTKGEEEAVSAGILPSTVLKEYWQTFSQPTKDIAQIVTCLHLLAGILRGFANSPQKNKQKAQQERAVLTGKFVSLLSGILSTEYQAPRGDKRGLFKTISGAKTQDEEEVKALIQKAALVSLRASLPVKERRKLSPNVFNVLKSNEALDSVSMRHILALSVDACEKSTTSFSQEIKFRLQTTMEIYGPTGYLFPYQEGTAARSGAPNGSSPPLRLTDPFSRKYLAQALGLVVKEGGKKSKDTVFWNAVVLMACGDPSWMVSFEAMRALMGATKSSRVDPLSKSNYKIDFEVDIDHESNEKDGCFAAWQNLMKDEVPSALYARPEAGGGRSKKRTILSHCIDHLRDALSQGSHAIIAGACRVICDLGRCHAYAFSANPNQKMWHRASVMLNPLREEILHYATNGSYGTAIQYLSLKALIWLQGADGGPLTPSVITRILSNGRCLAPELMSDILQTLFQRFIVQPSMSSYILDCVNAVVAGNPSNAVPVELVDFWFYSVEHSDKAQVLNAALQFLEAPLPPRACHSSGGELGAVAETHSAWRKLKRTVTLWLGSAVAFLAEDNPWQERPAVSLDTQGQSTTDLISAEVTQNPLLMSTVSHFAHDLSTGSWESRMAAARALTCIAIQCQEPYRIQIYGVFKDIMSSSEAADLFGLHSVLTEAVDLLDEIYSGQLLINECVEQWGRSFSVWPPEMAESVQNKHAELLRDIMQHCQVPPESFFPLGPKSRALILGEDVPEPTHESGVGFEPPQVQYSDYLRQGSSSYLDEQYDTERPEAYIYDEEDRVEQPLEQNSGGLMSRESERTEQFMNVPSLQQLVRQSSEVRSYKREQQQETFSYQPPEEELGPPVAEEMTYEVDEKVGYGKSEIEESPSSYERNSSSMVEDEPWKTALNNQSSYGSPSFQAGAHGGSLTMDNPFNQGIQPFETGFEAGPRFQVQEGFPKRAAVLFDFEAEMEGELTVTIGDIITVLSEIEGGWYFASVQNVMGMKNEGIVPCDYVELQED